MPRRQTKRSRKAEEGESAAAESQKTEDAESMAATGSAGGAGEGEADGGASTQRASSGGVGVEAESGEAEAAGPTSRQEKPRKAGRGTKRGVTQEEAASTEEATGGAATGGTPAAGGGALEPEDQTGERAAAMQAAKDAAAAAGAGIQASAAAGSAGGLPVTSNVGPLQRVLYVLKQPPTCTTLREFRAEAAARYSMPPDALTLLDAASGAPLDLDAPLDAVRAEVKVLLAEATGLVKEWLFWFDRGGQELGITPAAQLTGTTAAEALLAAPPSVVDTGVPLAEPAVFASLGGPGEVAQEGPGPAAGAEDLELTQAGGAGGSGISASSLELLGKAPPLPEGGAPPTAGGHAAHKPAHHSGTGATGETIGAHVARDFALKGTVAGDVHNAHEHSDALPDAPAHGKKRS